MSHSCGIGVLPVFAEERTPFEPITYIPPPIQLTQSFNIEDANREKDRFEAQLKTYNELLEIQNEQLRTRDDELKRLRDELHNVVQTRELERQTTTTQDSFTYLLLQRENNKLADKVKSLEELYEKMKAEYERQLLEFKKVALSNADIDSLQPPKLVRQIAYTAEVPPLDLSEENLKSKIASNDTKIKKLKKKSLLKKKQDILTEKLRRLSAGKSANSL